MAGTDVFDKINIVDVVLGLNRFKLVGSTEVV